MSGEVIQVGTTKEIWMLGLERQEGVWEAT